MKRILVHILLIVLVIAELWLLTGFLPQRWQEKISDRLSAVWPSQSSDYSRITHPNLDWELQPYKPWGMVLIGVLAVANGSALVALWRRRNA
jgi:hypothetical protein